MLLDNYEGRSFFKASNDLKGRVILKTKVDGQKIEH